MGFWWVNVGKGHHFEDADLAERIIWKCIFQEI